MTQTAQNEPGVARVPLFTITTVAASDLMTVCVTGELDLDCEAEVTAAFLDGRGRAIVVDMANLGFMDCGGYRAIGEARRDAEANDKSFTVTNAHGVPARLLGILDERGLL